MTRKYFEKHGCIVGSSEQRVPIPLTDEDFARAARMGRRPYPRQVTRDLWHWVDIVVADRQRGQIYFVQTTTLEHASHRRTKITMDPEASATSRVVAMIPHCHALVLDWAKRGPKQRWTPRIMRLTPMENGLFWIEWDPFGGGTLL